MDLSIRYLVDLLIISHRIHDAGIYANIRGILMGSMLPYIAAPWILWVLAAIFHPSTLVLCSVGFFSSVDMGHGFRQQHGRGCDSQWRPPGAKENYCRYPIIRYYIYII